MLASAQYVAIDLTPEATHGAMGFAASAGIAAGSVMAPGLSGAYVQHGAVFSGGNTTDIHPASWAMSLVASISGNQMAGSGLVSAGDASNGTHAILWPAPGAAFVDLSSSAFTGSGAACTNGTMQAGFSIAKARTSGKIKTTPGARRCLVRISLQLRRFEPSRYRRIEDQCLFRQ